MAEISLARDFPLSSEADWQALVKEALKGAPLSSLGTTSYDGIGIEPLYARPKDGNVISGREPGEAWAVMQRVDLPDAETANTQILDDLNNAARGIVLVFEGAVGDYGYALPATEAAIEAVLKGVHLDWGVPIELDSGPPSRQAAVLVANDVRARGFAPGSVNIRFGFDPLGAMATRGVAHKPW
ncbi:MAG: methylmalonyl-CoA mutase family protein, partial [Methyloceanibacter sp.]